MKQLFFFLLFLPALVQAQDQQRKFLNATSSRISVSSGNGTVSESTVQNITQPTRDSLRRTTDSVNFALSTSRVLRDSAAIQRTLINSINNRLSGLWSESATLSGKTISGSSNTITGIPQAAITGLSNALSGKQDALSASTTVGSINGAPLTWGGSITIPGAPSTASTNLRYARDFSGLVGDGVTNVATVLSNWINTNTTAATLMGEKGSVYLCNSNLVLNPGDNTEIDLNGATIRSGSGLNSSNSFFITIRRSSSARYTDNAAAITVRKGDRFFLYPNASTLLTVGDIFRIYGGVYWPNADPDQSMRHGWYGEAIRINGDSVFTSAPADGSVAADGSPEPWVSTSLTMFQPVRGVKFKNGVIDVRGKTTGGALDLQHLIGCEFDNFAIIGNGVTTACVDEGVKLYGVNNLLNRFNVTGTDDNPGESSTYPMNINGADNTVQWSYVRGGNSINSADRLIYSQNINYLYNTVFTSGSGAGLSYHGNSSGIVMGNTVHGGFRSNSVVNIGRSNTKVAFNTIYKQSNGPAITVADQALDNIEIFSNDLFNRSTNGLGENAMVIRLGSRGANGVIVRDNLIEGLLFVNAKVRDLQVVGNTFRGSPTHVTGIFLNNGIDTLSDFYIANNRWYSGLSSGNGGSYNWFLKVPNGSPSGVYGTIEKNLLYAFGGNTGNLFSFEGPTGTILINDNTFYSNNTGVAPVHTGSGGAGVNYYLSGNRIRNSSGTWRHVAHLNTALPPINSTLNGRTIDVQQGTSTSTSPVIPYGATKLQGGTWSWQPFAYAVQ